jgi:hypothetical protein
VRQVGWVLVALVIMLALPATDAAALCPVLTCEGATVSAPSVSALAATRVTLSATIEPNGEATSYQFRLSVPDNVDEGVVSPTMTTPASLGSVPVTWKATGLIPGTQYVATVEIDSTNGPSTMVSTPLWPAIPFTIHPARRYITTGDVPTITARVPRAAADESVLLEQRDQFGRWMEIGNVNVANDGMVRFRFPAITSVTSNVVLRAVLTGDGAYFGPDDTYDPNQVRVASTAEAITQYVLPRGFLSLHGPAEFPARPGGPNVPGEVWGTISLQGPTTRPVNAPGQWLYLYVRGRGGVFRRVVRERYRSLLPVYFHDPRLNTGGGSRFLVCLKHQLTSDLGTQFSFPACGASTVRDDGPPGSEFLVRNATARPAYRETFRQAAGPIDPCGIVSCSGPSVSVVAVTATATTATFSATINPGGAATSYTFSCTCSSSTGVDPTVTGNVPASFSAVSVSGTVTDLAPNKLDQVDVSAQNGYGNATGPNASFRTPIAPGLRVRLIRPSTRLSFGSTPQLTALTPATGADGAIGELQVADPGSSTYRTVSTSSVSSLGEIMFPGTSGPEPLARNVEARVLLTGCIGDSDDPTYCEYQRDLPSHSNAIRLLVFPTLLIGYIGDRYPRGRPETSQDELATILVRYETAPVGRRYRGPRVFLYVRLRGVFHRLDAAPLRARLFDDTQVTGSRVPGAVFDLSETVLRSFRQRFLVCTRSPVSVLNGSGFAYADCGARVLTSRAPAGAAFAGVQATGATGPFLPWR